MKLEIFSKLRGVLVETRSGQQVGHLKDFQLDLETLKVYALLIKPAGLVKNLFLEELMVNADQIVEVTAEKIIVDDSSVKAGGKKILAGEFKKNMAADTGAMVSSDQA